MRGKLLSVFLFAMIIIGLLIADVPFGKTQSGTNESGIINSDKTWTKAGSPYNLTGNVLVDSGATVTIEANTIVNFNDHYIRVNGTLIVQPGVILNMKAADTSIQVNGLMTARGTSDNPIHINGDAGYVSIIGPSYYSRIIFSKSSVGWNESTSSGSIIGGF